MNDFLLIVTKFEGKGPFKYYVIQKVGGWVRPNDYVCLLGGWVGGWVWRNAYVIIRITKNEIPEKDQIDLAIFEV